MSKFRLLLLDANVVIYLFRLGLWDHVVEHCDVHLAETVVDESDFYKDENGYHHKIVLTPYIKRGDITTFNVPLGEIRDFRAEFSKMYQGVLDDGETESLTYLLNSTEEYVICSADHIVFRVLGSRYRSDQGISLEELLQALGRTQTLDHQFTKRYREQCTSSGFVNGIHGRSSPD